MFIEPGANLVGVFATRAGRNVPLQVATMGIYQNSKEDLQVLVADLGLVDRWLHVYLRIVVSSPRLPEDEYEIRIKFSSLRGFNCI